MNFSSTAGVRVMFLKNVMAAKTIVGKPKAFWAFGN
jgi:hypothetical protein